MADEAQILALEEWLWTEGADLRGRRVGVGGLRAAG